MKKTQTTAQPALHIKTSLQAGSYEKPKPCGKCLTGIGDLICYSAGRCPEDAAPGF